jgi:DNA-binding MurR/RpiR family transcriptional regulator
LTVRFCKRALDTEALGRAVAITNFRESPLVATADLVLTTSAREAAFHTGALRSRIAQFMVVDCLFTGVAQASYDASMEALRRTYTVVHDGGTQVRRR